MIELIVAAAFVCMYRDSHDSVDAWLRQLGMVPVAVATSDRFKQKIILWRGGVRYAVVMPEGNRTCVLDIGSGWKDE